MGGTLTNLIYHTIFSTKNREPMIIPEIRPVNISGRDGNVVPSGLGKWMAATGD